MNNREMNKSWFQHIENPFKKQDSTRKVIDKKKCNG